MNGTVVDTIRLSKRLDESTIAWATSTRPGIRLLDLPSTHVRLRVGGQGNRTIVFACDPPNVIEQYDEIIALLGQDHRVVVFEQPGFGFSFPKPGFSFTRHEYAEVLLEMLRLLDMAPYALAFPCVSGFYALGIAAKYPELVHHLILMQIGTWSNQKSWARRVANAFTLVLFGVPALGATAMKIPYLGQVLGALAEPFFTKRTYPFVLYRGRKNVALLKRFREPTDAAFARGACNCQPSFYQRFFREPKLEMENITSPTLVLWTQNDRSHLPENRNGILQLAPHAQIRDVANVGHHLELEDPDQACAIIRDFLLGQGTFRTPAN